jgi:glycosyltransferase involved in cell wall biosynthesis
LCTYLDEKTGIIRTPNHIVALHRVKRISKELRVALINNAPPNTGFGRYAFKLQELLRDSGITVDHYLFNRNSWSLDKVSGEGLRSICKARKNPMIDNAFFMKLDKLPNLSLDYRLGRFIPIGYDLYHLTNQTMCNINYYRNISRSIVTVHDVIFYVYPTNYLKKSLSKLVYRGLRNCNKIISVSKATKDDLVRYFQIPEQKIAVIPEGVSKNFRPLLHTDVEHIYERYKLDKNYRYIMHVGNPEPRKNVITLIKSFHHLITDLKVKDIRLIKINQLSKADRGAIKELDLQNYVKIIDCVTDEDLISLYNIANVFVFPSFYEGFGFPPLEAMACGTPVIASNTSSMPEIIGDAGIMIDPQDVNGFAGAIYEVLANQNLRRDMIKKGLEKARGFNWEKCAKGTLDIYGEFAGDLK